MKINFIRTLLITLIIIYVIDSFQHKHKHSKYLLSAFLIHQLFTSIIIHYLSSVIGAENNVLYLISSILINALNLDGGIVFVVIGVFMYIFRNNNKKLALSFAFITIIYFILFNTQLIVMLDSSLIHFKILYDIFSFLTNNIIGVTPNIVTSDIIYGNPQWMMLLSLPFILKYNGKKGYGLKLLFYIFYPLHIILLCILSIISR